jgi:hypothetical protein
MARGYLVGGCLLLVLAVAGGAFFGGWVAANRYAAARVSPVVEPSFIEIPSVPEGVRMPDVRGLEKEGALQVLADMGWDIDTVELLSEPFAGPEGIVIEQSPPFGVSEIGTIELTLSKAAQMPEFEGRDSTSFVDELRQLGVNVALQYAYSAAVAAGNVLAVEPLPGEALALDATVTVAESGTALYLGQLPAVESSLRGNVSASLDGQSYPNSATGEAYWRGPEAGDGNIRHNVYVLGRHADVFQATVGIPDDAQTTTGTVRVTLVGDGQVLTSVDVYYGHTAELTATVTGVLRLDIQVAFATPPPENQSSQAIALGDGRVVGSDDQIALLAEGQ